jgi:nitrite reductase (NO-forming) / hydroxylamine reductase
LNQFKDAGCLRADDARRTQPENTPEERRMKTQSPGRSPSLRSSSQISRFGPRATLIATAALLIAAAPFAAWSQDKKNVAPGDVQYHAAPSALTGVPMVQSSNPKAPPMTQAEFDTARNIYFQRCAGCHGVLRKGATGKALTPDITLGKGTDYLKIFIAYGSPAGMPK